MKTFSETVEKPRLVIKHDSDSDSPREWDNLGYFIIISSRMSSPDQPKGGDIYDIVKSSGDDAENQKDHIRIIKERIEDETKEGKVLAIYPVTKHEHGNVVFKLGNAHGFDDSNNGFYIVTEKSAKNTGVKRSQFEKIAQVELETYTQWCNGEVYGYELYNLNGELENSCYGFYSLSDIKNDLPEEWKNEDMGKYIVQ